MNHTPILLGHSFLLKDDNPDKGTETCLGFLPSNSNILSLKDDNPDKGTETKRGSIDIAYSLLKIRLKDDNPDKGTETFVSRVINTFF